MYKTSKTLFLIIIALHILAIFTLFINYIEINLNILNISNLNDVTDQQIIKQMRLPNFLVAYFAGGLLSIMGYLLHSLTKNTLLETHILGLGACSNLGGLICLVVLPFANIPPLYGAFLLTLMACFYLFKQPKHLLLRGVMLGTIAGALITLILQFANQEALPSLLFWLMGDISQTTWLDVQLFGLVLATCTAFVLKFKNNIAYLWLGQAKAQTLIPNLKQLELQIFVMIAGITAFLSLKIGGIGFIGFVVPHFIYLWAPRLDVPKHLCFLILLGGAFLAFCTQLARLVIYPSLLPVGVLTAIIGAPIFLSALRRQK